MRALIAFLLLTFAISCSATPDQMLTKIPPHDGPAKYPGGGGISATLIGGKPVNPTDPFVQGILSIKTGNSGCTASLIGPRVMMSAAHCGKSGSESVFKVGDISYKTKNERSSIYPAQDHDILLGLVDKVVENAEPHSVQLVPPKVGDQLFLYGYGCIKQGGGGGNDGILRMGASQISSFTKYDMIAEKPGGAALCFGDSGGPAFSDYDGHKWQVGVNSKGNISDTSYLTRTDVEESKNFFTEFTAKHNVEICGFNKDCFEPPPPPAIKIEIESDLLGTFTVMLKPDTQEPDKVKTYLGNLIRYLEDDMLKPGSSAEPFYLR